MIPLRSRQLALICVAVLGLLTSACGARLSEQQLAAVAARGTGNGTGVAAGGGALGNGNDATGGTGTGSGTGTAASGGGGSGAATGGGAAGPSAGTGGSTGGGSTAGGTACTPTPGFKEVGVTDTEIKIGNVSTISGPVPGFGQTGVNGVKAYVNFKNSQGGVCGRKLTLVTADDRLDAGQHSAATRQLMGEVLGFAGNTTVVDNGGAGAIQGTNIASCSLAIGDQAIRSANYFSPNPIDPSGKTQGTAGMWKYFKKTYGITKVAIIYPAQADARARALAYKPDIVNAGLQVDGPYETAITETNYAGYATKMKNDGADAVITALEVNGMANLAKAFTQVNYKPKVPFYGAQAYGQDFVTLAGASAEGTVIGLAYSIFEDAAKNKAVADFVSWYGRSNPGSNPDFFAILAWAAADMFVQAVEKAGGAPSRDKVIANLRGFHAFDAHGLLAPNDPAGKKASPLFMVAGVVNGKWVRKYPTNAIFGTG